MTSSSRSDALETLIEASAAIDKSIQGSATTVQILNSVNSNSPETDKHTCSPISSDKKSLPQGHNLAGNILNEASDQPMATPLSETATLTPGEARTPESATPIATGMASSSSEKKKLENFGNTKEHNTKDDPNAKKFDPKDLKGWLSRPPFSILVKGSIDEEVKEEIYWSEMTWQEKNEYRMDFFKLYLSETKKCLPYVRRLFWMIYKISPWRVGLFLVVELLKGLLPALTLKAKGDFIQMV
jgi:hypothetical protein